MQCAGTNTLGINALLLQRMVGRMGGLGASERQQRHQLLWSGRQEESDLKLHSVPCRLLQDRTLNDLARGRKTGELRAVNGECEL